MLIADQMIVISGGGSGAEDVLKRFSPKAAITLDFFHVREHLDELLPHCIPRRRLQGRIGAMCAIGSSMKGRRLVPHEAPDLSGDPDSVRELHRLQVSKFRIRAHCMDYPETRPVRLADRLERPSSATR